MPRNHKDQWRNGFWYWLSENPQITTLQARPDLFHPVLPWEKWRKQVKLDGITVAPEKRVFLHRDGWQQIGGDPARSVLYNDTRSLSLAQIG